MNPLYNPEQYKIQNGQNSLQNAMFMLNTLQPNNPIVQRFGGMQNFQNQFQEFIQNFQRTQNVSPEDYVRQLLSSNQMSQSEFNQLAMLANMFLGK